MCSLSREANVIQCFITKTLAMSNSRLKPSSVLHCLPDLDLIIDLSEGPFLFQ